MDNITSGEFHDGDIVQLPEYSRTRFRIDDIKDGRAHFQPVKKDGTRDRRWDVGFTRSLAGVTHLHEKERVVNERS